MGIKGISPHTQSTTQRLWYLVYRGSIMECRAGRISLINHQLERVIIKNFQEELLQEEEGVESLPGRLTSPHHSKVCMFLL